MKIEKELLENHQMKLTVETDPDQLKEARQRAARQLARRTKIPGYRPGKAPYQMVERYVGEGAILEEALRLLVDEVYPKALEESGIRPYGPGRLEDAPEADPPTFVFVVPLEAEVELGDYASIRQDYDLKPVSEEDVEKVIENARQNQAVLEPAERPAQESDMVQVLLSAERHNPEEGQSPTLIQERSVPVLIESEDADTSVEWPFPGFSRNLIGMSAGDEKEVEFTFPEDSSFEGLRGQTATYRIKVENVKSRTLPEVNDELAASLGEYENLEALRSEVRTRLGEQSSQEYNENYDDQLIEQLIESATIKYPPEMLEDEIEAVTRQFQQRLSQQSMDLDTYLKIRKIDRDGLREELRPVAEKRIKRFLVLYKLANAENIQLKSEEVQAETMNALQYMTQGMSEKDVRRQINNEVLQNLAANISSDLLLRRATERLRAIGKGEGELSPADEAPAETTEAVAEPDEVAPSEGAEEDAAEPVEEEQPETTEGQQTTEKANQPPGPSIEGLPGEQPGE